MNPYKAPASECGVSKSVEWEAARAVGVAGVIAIVAIPFSVLLVVYMLLMGSIIVVATPIIAWFTGESWWKTLKDGFTSL